MPTKLRHGRLMTLQIGVFEDEFPLKNITFHRLRFPVGFCMNNKIEIHQNLWFQRWNKILNKNWVFKKWNYCGD